MYDVKELKNSAKSRRSFLKRMTAAGLGVAAASLLDFKPGRSGIAWGDTTLPELPNDFAAFPGIPGSTINIVVLNFALTLEILEADLYRQAVNAASGLPLSTPLKSSQSMYTIAVPGGQIPQQMVGAGYFDLVNFAFVEAAHRDFLSTAISAAWGTPVAANTGGYEFPTTLPANLSGILSLVLPLEETGVRAYLGALPYLTSLDYAQTAGTIYSTEARHSAAISEVLGFDAGPNMEPGDLTVTGSAYPSTNTFEYYLAPATVLSRASGYIVS